MLYFLNISLKFWEKKNLIDSGKLFQNEGWDQMQTG